MQPTSERRHLRAPPAPSPAPGAEGRLAAAARGLPELVRSLRRTGLAPEAAEDAAQGAFLIALEALPRIVEGRERAFVFATATRLAYGLRRRARRETANADLDLDPSPHPFPDELAQQKRFRERVHLLLDELETRSRTVFLLFEVDELSIPEIARTLAIAPDTARGRLRRARKDLRAAALDPRSPLFA